MVWIIFKVSTDFGFGTWNILPCDNILSLNILNLPWYYNISSLHISLFFLNNFCAFICASCTSFLDYFCPSSRFKIRSDILIYTGGTEPLCSLATILGAPRDIEYFIRAEIANNLGKTNIFVLGMFVGA